MAGTSLSLPFSGRRLREQRERRGLNQQRLADRCSAAGYQVSRSQISKYENDVHKPTPEALEGLAVVLGVKLDALLDLRAAS